MIFKTVSLLAVLVFTAVGSWAQTGKVTNFHLENGLQVVVIEDHRAPIVTNMVWYRVGSADEPPGKSGIAHFLEHLMFKGTKTLKPGDFSDIVTRNGGVDNAFTSYDYTGYFQSVAVDRLPLMMQLEADRMRNLVLTEEEVIPERNVILEERNSRVENDPGSLFREQRRAAMFMNHPYSNPVIGWRHEIAQLSLQDAVDFYRTYYAPNNAIVIVAGDVVPDDVLTLAKQYYGPLAPSDNIPPRVRPQEPPHRAPVRLTYEDPRIRQPAFMRTYLSPNRKSGDQKEAAALLFLGELLGGSGISSVLGRELQLTRKVATYTSAWQNGLSFDPDGFGIYAVPAPGVSLADLEAAVDEVLAEFLKAGVDADHLVRLKKQAAAERIYSQDNQDHVARRYGQALTAGLTIEDVQDWPDVLQSVTAKDIKAAALKVLNINQSVTGWQMPPNSEVSQ
ncbi:MAG: insulinase family protein [Rhodobacteraceae bacterium]|nr:insulinase family protein [Paracoccaceae bacterium]